MEVEWVIIRYVSTVRNDTGLAIPSANNVETKKVPYNLICSIYNLIDVCNHLNGKPHATHLINLAPNIVLKKDSRLLETDKLFTTRNFVNSI